MSTKFKHTNEFNSTIKQIFNEFNEVQCDCIYNSDDSLEDDRESKLEEIKTLLGTFPLNDDYGNI